MARPQNRLSRGAVRVVASAVRFVRYPPARDGAPVPYATSAAAPDGALVLPGAGGAWLALPDGSPLALPTTG